MTDEKQELPNAVRRFLSTIGRKGGKAGSRESKSKAGKAGHAAMIDAYIKKKTEEPDQTKPESQPNPEPSTQ